MSIANRVLFGFAAIILLMVALSIYSVQQIGELRGTMETIVTRDLTLMQHLHKARVNQHHMREERTTAVTRHLARALQLEAPGEDPLDAWPRYSAASEAALAEAQSIARLYAAEALTGERVAAFQEIGQLVAQAAGTLRQITAHTERQFQAIRAGDPGAILVAGAPLAANNDAFEQAMDRAAEVLNRAIASGQLRAQEAYRGSLISVLVFLGAALAVAAAIVFLIRRSIARPLGQFMEFVGRVGRGDLTEDMVVTSRDEFGQLGVTLNAMVDGLRQLARQSREATENLHAAAAEIRASTQEQAASVEEQLAAVQETAATVDEITHAGAQIGKRAQEVIATAQVTMQTSDAGLRAVDETTRAMDAIREQGEVVAANIVALSENTQAISEIISTVNDISERSHLLALNAAIEAAAAGEYGRSFSVVAAEMKSLADQAKEATAQVRSILGDIQRGINTSVMLTEEAVKRVAAGKEKTDTTHATISEITSRMQESVQTFQQIVASTNQQQLGIEQVMTALRNIRDASQQTAAGTRQLDSAAANLAGLAQQLVSFADRYRL